MALTVNAGQTGTAAAINNLVPLYVIKLGTETLSANTTLQNDDELFLDLAAGRTYHIDLNLICTGAQTPGDIKLAWARTGTINHIGSRTCLGPQIGTTDVTNTALRLSGGHGITTAVPYGTDASATNSYIHESLIVSVDVAGRLTLQWAQNTSSATVTSVTAGSYLRATPIG